MIVKRLLLFTFLLSLCLPSLSQDRWRCDLGMCFSSKYHPKGEMLLVEEPPSAEIIKNIELHSFNVSISPTYSMRVSYKLHERWFAVSSFGFNTLDIDYCNMFSNEITGHEDTYAYDILLGGRYVYATKAGFYVQALIGIARQGNAEYWERIEKIREIRGHKTNLGLGYQIGVGLTIDLTSRLYGNFDWGIGTEHSNPVMGGRVAIGVKL